MNIDDHPDYHVWSKLSRLEAIVLGMKISKAIDADDLVGACRLAGITDEMSNWMTIEQIGEAMRVRLAVIAQRAGVELPQ